MFIPGRRLLLKGREMKADKHQERHVKLHQSLDELFADYIGHHPNQGTFLDTPLKQFLDWSYEQTLNPTGQHTNETVSGREA